MAQPKIDFVAHLEKADVFVVNIDGKALGELRKAKHGPGFFLSLDDGKGGRKRWYNAAPGARIQQERDHVSYETYVKTMKAAKARVLENTPEEENKP